MKTYRESGFTLVEMMVSVAIFGVMASIIFPALIQFLDARESVDNKHKQLISMQKTFLFLAQDIRFASNRLGKDEFGDIGKATLSVGEDSLIELTSIYPDLNLDGLGVPRRVRWVLEDKTLQRIQYPVMDPDSDTRTIKQILLTGINNVEIELKEITESTEEVSSTWDKETKLPDLLSMTVEMESGIEYQRSFTMLNGDSLIATAAAQTGDDGGSDNGDSGSGDDVDSESSGSGL